MGQIIDFLLGRPSQKEKQLVYEIREKSDVILDICHKGLVGTETQKILFGIVIETARGLGRLESTYGVMSGPFCFTKEEIE